MGSTFFRRWIGGFLAVCLTLTGMPALCVSGAEPAVSAQSCILMEAVTGEILYEKQAQEQRPMASTTKIMTTLLCLESGDLDTEFPVDTDAIHVEGSSMGLVEGDIVTKRALCYGMLLPSGNDAPRCGSETGRELCRLCGADEPEGGGAGDDPDPFCHPVRSPRRPALFHGV